MGRGGGEGGGGTASTEGRTGSGGGQGREHLARVQTCRLILWFIYYLLIVSSDLQVYSSYC